MEHLSWMASKMSNKSEQCVRCKFLRDAHRIMDSIPPCPSLNSSSMPIKPRVLREDSWCKGFRATSSRKSLSTSSTNNGHSVVADAQNAAHESQWSSSMETRNTQRWSRENRVGSMPSLRSSCLSCWNAVSIIALARAEHSFTVSLVNNYQGGDQREL